MGVKDAAFTSSVQRFISEGARSGSHSAAADVFRCTPAAPLLSAVRNNDALFHAEKNTYRKPLLPLEVRRTERRISLCLSPCAPQESGCSGALGNWRPQSRRESFYRLKEEGGGEKRKEKKNREEEAKPVRKTTRSRAAVAPHAHLLSGAAAPSRSAASLFPKPRADGTETKSGRSAARGER